MNEEEKPDPDELLKRIQAEEKQQTRGKLKIFFGMAAGVGKTYAMLEEAQQRLKEGVNIVVGTINTHGRKETERLLEGLPIVPEKWVKYKDTVFEEFDLDTILSLKPQLVLVDELAHTNVPGSKHSKRWQDVIDILDAGIDVFTTLNVQHIESRKDIVEGMTGIKIRETVSDLILERAASIELVDIPPSELLQRLKEGKVYLGDQSLIAAQNFFKEDTLTALREIALRLTADKVDYDLHEIFYQGKEWRAQERLMVAVSASPSSQALIRATRKLAFELHANWIAVYVDVGQNLSDKDQLRLMSHLNLARELGAEVITTHDIDITASLQRIARQKEITRIIVGRPPQRRRKWFFNFFQESFIHRLENENKHIDIVIVRQDPRMNIYQRSVPYYQFSSSFQSYVKAALTIAGVTFLGFLLTPFIGYKAVGFIFLLSILVLSFFLARGPVFFAAFLSTLSWLIVFIPSHPVTFMADPEDLTLVILYFFSASVMGILTTRLKEQEQLLHIREENSERLYEVEREIANSANFAHLRQNVCAKLQKIFPGNFDILIRDPSGSLVFDSQLSMSDPEKEQAVATWVLQNGQIGGWSTNTLPSAEQLYIPIKYSKSTIGVLIYRPARNRPLSMDEMNFLQTVCQQIGVYLERFVSEEKSHKQEFTRQTEKLHHAILNSLSRSFYTPLEEILRIDERLKLVKFNTEERELFTKLEDFILNLKQIVDNIIGLSELESGFVHFEKKKHNLKDFIESCVESMKSFLKSHPIVLELPEAPVHVSFDLNLMRQAVNNLLSNATEFSAPDSPITLEAELLENEFRITVIDEGSGIPEGLLPMIFEKFYQVEGQPTKGMGLGLTIIKSVVDIHQGRIVVNSEPNKGSRFDIFIPIT